MPTASLLLALTLLGLLTLPLPAQAQVPDSVRTAPPDSVQTAPPDSMQRPRTETDPAPLRPLPFVRDAWATAPDTTRPVARFARDVPDALTPVSGAFLYDVGATGWPDGWSLRGFSPQQTTLWLDGVPFDDPLTGRPRFDLIPIEFLASPGLGADQLGAPSAVYTRFRTYDVVRPLTELRFRRNSGGLQSIGVAHVQQRRIRDGLLQVAGGFFGRAVDNEYPNSDLRKERRLYGRIHYRRERWAVMLSDLHSRRRIGAHSGVIPQGGFFETVFNRAIAQVEDPSARRKTIRNHLDLSVRAPLVPGLASPLLLTGYWTKQAFSYRNNPDTLAADTDRLGGRLRQTASWGRHHLHLEAGGYVDQLDPDSSLGLATTHRRAYATLRDSVALGSSALTLSGGWHTGDASAFPSAQVRWDHGRSRWAAFAEVRLTGAPRSWAEQHGFGAVLSPLTTLPTSRIVEGRLGAERQLGAFDIELEAFAHTIRDPVDLFSTAGRDTLAVQALNDPVHRVGGTLRMGWRRGTPAGLYATAQATALQSLNRTASAAHRRLANTLPEVWGRGRIGARFVAFAGDLDANLYLQGRAWTPFRSRVFHPPTALFAIPDANVIPDFDATFGPSGTLDVRFEAGIRGATLFLAYDNALSGTPLQTGTLLVPVYPLPEQNFRFGVYWPIEN